MRIILRNFRSLETLEATSREEPSTLFLAVPGPWVARFGHSVHLTAQMRQTLLCLLRGGVITKDEIIDALYNNRADGGPDWARNVIKMHIFKLREVGILLGLRIKTAHSIGWCLEEVDYVRLKNSDEQRVQH